MSSASNIARRIALGLIAALVLFSLVACPGPTFVVQQYGGPQRPSEAIAILRVIGREPVRLMFLDGEDVAAPIVEDGRLHIELLPGRHTVVVANANAPHERHAPITFQAEPGKVYRVAFAAGPSGSEARMFEVDRGSDSAIRDVTQAPATEPPPPPPAPARPPVEPPTALPVDEDAGTTAPEAGAPAPAPDAG